MDTKGKILHAAISLFSQHSAKEVTLQKIADHLGIAKSSIHYYYASKASIMNAIMDYAYEHLEFHSPTRDQVERDLQYMSSAQILKKYTLYRNDRYEYINLLRALYRLSFYNSRIRQLNMNVFFQYQKLVFHLLRNLRRLNAIPAGDMKTLATMWTNVTIVFSLMFTHGYEIYNEYCNTIHIFIKMAVNGVPALNNITYPVLPQCKRSSSESPDTTRGLIAHHAFQLFCVEGYERTTMRQIARETGIQVGGIYKHYGNKSEIMFEIMESAKKSHAEFTQPFNRYIKDISQSRNTDLLVEAFASCFLPTQDDQNKWYYRLVLIEQYRDPQVRKYYFSTLLRDCKLVETALNRFVMQNIIPSCPSRQLSLAYIFNQCIINMQSALLDRDMARSQSYRIKSAALLTGALISSACES